MSRILVTGANGFVGFRLSRVLLDCGYQVRAALRHHYSHNDLPVQDQVVVGDIDSETQWENVLHDIDCVVHLAARVHVMDESNANPLSEYRLVNVDGTINLARQAATADVKRFIYLSSIKVNGEISQTGAAFKEDDLPAPMDPYAVSKFEAEQAILKIATATGLKAVIIRPPQVYGPGVKANFFTMMQWLNRGIPLPFGAINNKRSLVYLDNLVNLIITCIEHPSAPNQTFLVGDGEDMSTTELLQRMGQALGKPARLIPLPAKLLERLGMLAGRQALVQRLCGSLQVDFDKTEDLLHWKPVVTVDDALKKTARAYLEEKITR